LAEGQEKVAWAICSSSGSSQPGERNGASFVWRCSASPQAECAQRGASPL